MRRFAWKAAIAAAAIYGTTGQADAQVNLILTTMAPAGNEISTKFFRPLADRINAAAGGAIVVDPRDGFAVANFANVYDRVMNDVVQVGWAMQGMVGGKFPLTEVATFPFEADTAEQSSVALWRLYASGAFGNEYGDLKPVILGTYPMNGVHFAKRPKTTDDFSGLKLRAASKPQGDWITNLGGSPVSLPAEDLYSALQRGTIDATLQAWSTFGPLKLADVTNFHLDVQFGTSTIMVFMTKQKYDSLAANAKKAIDDNSGEATSRAWGKFYEEIAARLRKEVLAKPGQASEVLTPAQLDSWRKRVQPVQDAWVKAHPGGPVLLSKYRAAVADLKAGK